MWHQPLDEALLSGGITAAQHPAIRRGLDRPPSDDASVLSAWRAAATELLGEAGAWTVEELERNARTLRDMLDPEGALARLQEQFEKRSATLTRAGAGPRKLIMVLDDEIAVWVQHLFDSALRPRRGGPRFMTDEERAAAQELIDDPRTNEQLAYDLLVDVLRAGARAQAKDVFGTREPGVRLVAAVDDVDADRVRRTALGSLIAVATTEDYGLALSGAILEKALCETGAIEIAVDCSGNPLALGRTRRTYSAAQKLALSVRDGGCTWPGCDRPPSSCEAHHCVPWEEGGKTDCEGGEGSRGG